MLEPVVGDLEVEQRGHQRFGHEAATEGALQAPSAGIVGLEQAGVDRARPEGHGGAVEPGSVGTFDEERHRSRVLERPAGWARLGLDAAGGIDADGRDIKQRFGHVRCVEAAGEDDRDTGRDGPGSLDRGAAAGAAECRRIAGVEQDGLQVGLGLVGRGLPGEIVRRRPRHRPRQARAAP